MSVKKLNAKYRNPKAHLRTIEARLRRKTPRFAARLEQLEELDLRNVSRERRPQLLQGARGIHAFLCWRTAYLRDRLGIALACKRLRTLLSLPLEAFSLSAYLRDFLITEALDLRYRIAKRDDDRDRMEQINFLKERWDRADKGALGKSEIGKEALSLLRKLHFYETYCRHDRSSKKFKDKLLAQILTASSQFLSVLSKAKAFREKRGGQKGMTEEECQRADFTAIGIVRRLAGKENGTWKDLLPVLAPDWKDTPQNFQKLLGECLILFEPAGQWRGQQKCVRKRGKNIH